MIFTDKKDFLSHIGDNSQLFGLDIGNKTIGIAISDKTRTIATPFYTINRVKFTKDIIELQKLIKADSIAGLVIGLPLNMDGTDSRMAQSIKQFARNLLKEFDIPIFFCDESFTSIAAERSLMDAEMSRAKRDKVIDKVAASLILQGFLDSI